MKTFCGVEVNGLAISNSAGINNELSKDGYNIGENHIDQQVSAEKIL